jgi:mannose-6-phosphate isomerase-like protein (cupin superfamily)
MPEKFAKGLEESGITFDWTQGQKILPTQVVEKPWGNFEQFTHNQQSTIKVIQVRKGRRLSLQSHKKRDERWIIMSGAFKATINDEEFIATEGMQFYINREGRHRLEALKSGSKILEISFGEFDENDITRYADDHGRAQKFN